MDKYGAFHANQTSMCLNPRHNYSVGWYLKTSLSTRDLLLIFFRYLLFLFVYANTRCLFVATLWSPVREELTSLLFLM